MIESLRQLSLTFASNIQNAGFLPSPNNEVAADCDDLIDFHTAIFGRSRVRFPMVSLEFFSDTILPVALWP